MVGSQQPVWGPPVGSATSSLRGSGDSGGSGSLRGNGDSSDRIPAHRGSVASSSSSSDGLGSAAAPQGSAWNPWQGEQLREQAEQFEGCGFHPSGCSWWPAHPVLHTSPCRTPAPCLCHPAEHAVPPPPLPPRRVVAHRPSPSWFSPVLGFGGPASCVWQEEEQRRSAERQQMQQAQWQHAQQAQQQPQEQQAAQVNGQQQPQEQQAFQVNGRQQPQEQRSIPWYQQGWQQQPRKPQQAASLQYPSNPFTGEPCGSIAAEPAAAGGAPSSQQRSGSSQLGDGSSSGRRLPPPPRFLLARKAQEAQQQAQQAQQHPAVPAPASSGVQQAGFSIQPSTARAATGPAHAAQDVQPRGMGPQDASCAVGTNSGHAEQQQQPAAAPLPPPLPSAGPARGAAQPPPPPPPPPGRLAARPAGAPPPPPAPPLARPSAGPAGAPPPPPPPPPKAAPKSRLSQPPPAPPSNAAGKLPASMQPSPAPAAAAAQPPAPPPVPVAPAGGSALSAIRADELLAAAGRLRKVQPGGGVREPAGGSAAADGTAAGPAPAADPRAALLDQIKNGVKLRPVEARKQPPLPAAAAPSGKEWLACSWWAMACNSSWCCRVSAVCTAELRVCPMWLCASSCVPSAVTLLSHRRRTQSRRRGAPP